MNSSTIASLRELLPHLFELRDATDVSLPTAYFHDFESRFAQGRTVLRHFQKLERHLAMLDDEAWRDLKPRAAAVAHIRNGGRGWQALFDVFNEATGYGYLRSLGSTHIRFIKRSQKQTPDLAAVCNGQPVLCEVKTINISQEEAERRDRIHQGEIIGSQTSPNLPSGFLRKIEKDLTTAIGQLASEDVGHKARWIVFTVLHFNDWVGDYQPEYFAQLDDYLSQRPSAGAELVFRPWANLFERQFTMRAAHVFLE